MTTPRPRAALRRRLTNQPGDRGAVTVELILSLPIWVALLLFVLLCGRLVTAQLDVDAAAHNGARAASLARTSSSAQRDAREAITQTLSDRNIVCQNLSVSVDDGGLTPGVPVQVQVTCHTKLSDLGLLGVPGSRAVSSTSTAPVDLWRGTP